MEQPRPGLDIATPDTTWRNRGELLSGRASITAIGELRKPGSVAAYVETKRAIDRQRIIPNYVHSASGRYAALK